MYLYYRRSIFRSHGTSGSLLRPVARRLCHAPHHRRTHTAGTALGVEASHTEGENCVILAESHPAHHAEVLAAFFTEDAVHRLEVRTVSRPRYAVSRTGTSLCCQAGASPGNTGSWSVSFREHLPRSGRGRAGDLETFKFKHLKPTSRRLSIPQSDLFKLVLDARETPRLSEP